MDKAAKPTTILDHIDNISVDGNVFESAHNEFGILVCFHTGMESLYNFAEQCDSTMRRLNGPGSVMFGEVREIPTKLLVCAFHWYAMSAYQYALTVGAIAYLKNDSRPKPMDYVKSVMPEILAFRNKAAAHVAWSVNSPKDNDAERFASVVPLPIFFDDSYHIGMVVGATTRGNENTSEKIIPWSICKTHERIRKRYWPAGDMLNATLAIQFDATQWAKLPNMDV